MRTHVFALAAALALSGCAAGTYPPQQPVAALPIGFFNPLIDPDLGAINEASYSFGSPGVLRGDPVATLRAVICVEYLAVEGHSPRWAAVSPLTDMGLDQSRDELRRTLGIAPNAAPPLVINTLLRLMQDLQTGNMTAARALIRPPLFSLPPDQVLARLTNPPSLPTTHAATQMAMLQSGRIR